MPSRLVLNFKNKLHLLIEIYPQTCNVFVIKPFDECELSWIQPIDFYFWTTITVVSDRLIIKIRLNIHCSRIRNVFDLKILIYNTILCISPARLIVKNDVMYAVAVGTHASRVHRVISDSFQNVIPRYEIQDRSILIYFTVKMCLNYVPIWNTALTPR